MLTPVGWSYVYIWLYTIMPPRMRTQSAGRPAAESLGEGTGVRVGRGGRGRRPREGNDERVEDLNGQGNDQGLGANGGNLIPATLAQVSNRENVGNQNGNVVNENVQENIGNVLVNGNQVGCSYKEFLACNPKEYDGKGGVVVLTCWIEKMENVQDMSGCSNDQKVKYTAGSFVGMDWLSNYKAEIICHEKASDTKQEEMLWFRDFLRIFPGLVLSDYSLSFREIEFQIELIPEAMPVAKSPYRLAPSEMEELSGN
ncbi:hypothetical protein Tco_0958904 [Tanacetum coccineum]